MYRNALERFSGDVRYTIGERAETVMVFFVAAGCSASVRTAVAYTSDYVRAVLGGRMATPEVASHGAGAAAACTTCARSLALCACTGRHLREPPLGRPRRQRRRGGQHGHGAQDIADVDGDVSALHLRVACEDGIWRATDLDSTNGTVLLSGATGEERRLEPHEPVAVASGDELRLGATTRFMVVTGATTAV